MIGDPVERFHPTSGRALGVVGCLLVGALLVLSVLEGWGLAATGVVLLVLLLCWAAMLRPRVALDHDLLRVRGMFSTTLVPLAAVEEVSVRQVLAVRVGRRRVVSSAVGRKLRQIIKQGPDTTADPDLASLAESSYAEYVEHRIRLAAESERTRLGIDRYSDEQVALAGHVRREPAPLELAVLAVSVVLVVAGVVLG